MVWILPEQDNGILEELAQQSDRSAAIVAAACLEDRLASLLRGAFEEQTDAANRMLGGYGALASFRAKIDMGLLLGLYDKDAHKKLNIIKEIRNEFAHNPSAASFNSQRISDLCGNLCELSDDVNVKEVFDGIELTRELIDTCLLEGGDFAKAAAIAFNSKTTFGENTPRNRYILTIKRKLFYFYLINRKIEVIKAEFSKDPSLRYWPWSLP
jgi:hypothetical protein